MSTAIPGQRREVSPAPALTPYRTADIPDLDRLLSHGYSARAAVHLKGGDLDAALADLDTALQLFGDNSEALYLRGLVHQQRDDQPQAEVDRQLAAHLGWPDREGAVPSSPCELCYQVTGYTGYVDLIPGSTHENRQAMCNTARQPGHLPEEDPATYGVASPRTAVTSRRA